MYIMYVLPTRLRRHLTHRLATSFTGFFLHVLGLRPAPSPLHWFHYTTMHDPSPASVHPAFVTCPPLMGLFGIGLVFGPWYPKLRRQRTWLDIVLWAIYLGSILVLCVCWLYFKTPIVFSVLFKLSWLGALYTEVCTNLF
jgi:hypothetical protein